MSFVGINNFRANASPDTLKSNFESSLSNFQCIFADENTKVYSNNSADSTHSIYLKNNILVFSDSNLLNKKKFQKAFNLLNISDAELIHYLYSNNKIQKIKDFIGKFTFLVFDNLKNQAYAYSDQIGQKELYFSYQSGFFIFSSDISLIQESGLLNNELNEDRLLEYIIFSMQLEEETFFKKIKKLKRGMKLTLINENLSTSPYFNLQKPDELILKNDQEYAEAFREIFMEVVNDNIEADQPTSIALSGGLDSSSIISVAAQNKQNRIVASTFKFIGLDDAEEIKTDESKYQEEVYEKYPNLKKNIIQIENQNPIKYLNDNLQNYEEPIVAVNIYLIDSVLESLQSKNTKVHIEGFDGDSVVSHGYERLYGLGKNFKIFKLFKEAKALKEKSGKDFTYASTLKEYVFKPFLKTSNLISNRNALLNEKIKRVKKGVIQDSWIENKLNKMSSLNLSDQSDTRNLHLTTLQHPIWEDAICSMNKAGKLRSIDIRNPFFDLRLIHFCLSLPDSQKLKNGKNRYILRNSMQNIVPEKILQRFSKSDISPLAEKTVASIKINDLKKQIFNNDSILDKYLDKRYFDEIFSNISSRKGDNVNWLTVYHIYALSKWVKKNNF